MKISDNGMSRNVKDVIFNAGRTMLVTKAAKAKPSRPMAINNSFFRTTPL